MKFDLISDFHVEMNVMYKSTRIWKEGEPVFYAWHSDKKSDILVIAGDVANAHREAAIVVEEAAAHYEHVIYVDGNHEHYSNYRNDFTVMRDMEWFNTRFNSRNRNVENVTYLNGGDVTYQKDDTLFIGANGWYDFLFAKGYHTKEQQRAWRNQSNDPVCIRFGKKNRPEKLATRQGDELAKRVTEAQDDDSVKNIVVVTHTIPHWDGFNIYKNPSHPWYVLNGAYGNAYMEVVRTADKAKKIKAWVFGHTHEQNDFWDEGIRYVSNPRGYRGEKKTFGDRQGFNGIKQIDLDEPEIASAFGEIEPEEAS